MGHAEFLDGGADRRDPTPSPFTSAEHVLAFDAVAVYALPEAHRTRLRSTNMLERYNQELKRRTRVVRILPNGASCLRLVCALAIETNEE